MDFGIVDVVPSPQSQSSIHYNEQEAKKISNKWENSLYISNTEGPEICNVTFKGMSFARNSIYFRGILFNVSSLSLSLPFSAVDLDLSYRYCVIPRETRHIVPDTTRKKFIQFIAFEFGSQLTRIDTLAFCDIPQLRSICLPRSVETVCSNAFTACDNLSLFAFERGSILTRIEDEAFIWCQSPKSVRLPASLQFLHGAFDRATMSQITVEGGSGNFRVLGDFLMDIEGVTVVRYFGFGRNLTLSVEIETLGLDVSLGLLDFRH
jgi:hypothetical protein